MLKVTRWSPDTCGCVLEYEWDTALEGSDRIHSFKRVVKLCPEHERLGLQSQAAYDQVMSENKLDAAAILPMQVDDGVTGMLTGNNRAWGLIKQELNLADEDIEKYVWFFNESRQLQASVTQPIAAEKRQEIQAKLDTLLGAGKAKVV